MSGGGVRTPTTVIGNKSGGAGDKVAIHRAARHHAPHQQLQMQMTLRDMAGVGQELASAVYLASSSPRTLSS